MFQLHFGLGVAKKIERIEISWPSGLVEYFEGAQLELVGTNRLVHITEGVAVLTNVAPKTLSGGAG